MSDTVPSSSEGPWPEVSLLLVTRDANDLVPRFLRGLEHPTSRSFELIVNADPESGVALEEILRSSAVCFPARVLRENHRVAQARRRAAEVARGKYLYFLDADMILVPGLIDECAELCEKEAEAVIVTEEQVIEGWWSRCKWLDKRLARGSDLVESARFFTSEVYWRVGGHDDALSFGEDKDLDCRIRDTGAILRRTVAAVLHDDGRWTLGRQFRRSAFWGSTMVRGGRSESRGVQIQSSIGWRFSHYAHGWRTIAKHPLLFGGLIALRSVELLGAGWGRFRVRSGGPAPGYSRR